MTGLALVVAALLGSLLGGQIVGRLRGLDLRNSGSGNLGATNALRSGGVKMGLVVLLIDALKAWLAAAWVPLLVAQPASWLPWACGGLAVLAHIYSPWAGFKGGKGVACGLGACIALLPGALLWGLLGFICVLVASGYVSLSVMAASSLIVLKVACFSAWGLWSWPGAFALGMMLLLSWTHRDNLRRLARGNENRFEKIMLIKPRA